MRKPHALTDDAADSWLAFLESLEQYDLDSDSDTPPRKPE